MGTRADFYVGRGETAEWLGSIAWDGYPDGIFPGAGRLFDEPLDEAGWRAWVADFFADRDDVTLPEQGWPWPWKDSRTTDYAYAFDGDAVWGSCFGYEWFRVDINAAGYGEVPDEDEGPRRKTAVFPDMTSRQNVTFGRRSGALFVSLPEN